MKPRRRKRIGENWRVCAYAGSEGKLDARDVGEFDELVVGHVIHIESMDPNTWDVHLGAYDDGAYLHLTLSVDKQGVPRITIIEKRGQIRE